MRRLDLGVVAGFGVRPGVHGSYAREICEPWSVLFFLFPEWSEGFLRPEGVPKPSLHLILLSMIEVYLSPLGLHYFLFLRRFGFGCGDGFGWRLLNRSSFFRGLNERRPFWVSKPVTLPKMAFSNIVLEDWRAHSSTSKGTFIYFQIIRFVSQKTN